MTYSAEEALYFAEEPLYSAEEAIDCSILSRIQR